MKRSLAFLLISASTFLLATVLTRAYFRWDVQFYSTGVGSMGMCEEGFGGFTSLESYDGERLRFARIRFPSEVAAKECFHSSTQNGIDVLSSENLMDEAQTYIVGERIVGKNVLDGHDSGIVFSRDGEYIIEIASTSLRHALIFEKRSRKY
jgi:hypothetical protein